MAGRGNKVNLDYFELDCHMDNKIELIEAEYGLKGFAIVVKLYQRIYGGEFGYYCEFTPDIALLLASRFCGSSGGVSGRVGIASDEGSLSVFPNNLITDVVAASIRRDIFSERLFEEYGILTSRGIQKQYLKATAKREVVELKEEYLLISVPKNRSNVVINSISDGRNSISGVRNAQSRVDKSKSNKNTERAREAQGLEEFISAYPKKCNRHLTEIVYCDLIMGKVETEDKLITCAKNYAEYCRIKGLTDESKKRYIKNAENFLKEFVFEEYLPGKYKKPDIEKPEDKFKNFEQREYDFDEIERRLLAGNAGSDGDG